MLLEAAVTSLGAGPFRSRIIQDQCFGFRMLEFGRPVVPQGTNGTLVCIVLLWLPFRLERILEGCKKVNSVTCDLLPRFVHRDLKSANVS